MARFTFSAFADEAGDSLAEQLKALKDNGINYIEPRKINGKGILALTEDELYEIKAELDKNGIKVNSLGSPIGKYDIDAPLEEHLSDLKKAFTACKILGTDKIRMFSFFVPKERLTECRDEVIRRLTVMADMAEAEGITLCHENDSKIYGEMPREVLDILTSVPKLGAIFDPANYRMNDADVIAGINATFTNLAYLHIKDAIYDSQTIVPAGEGEGRIAEIIDMVDAHTDSLVYLTLEPHLHIFGAYKDIDEHELKGKYKFSTNREAFDFAVNALEALLKKNGYVKDENAVWKK